MLKKIIFWFVLCLNFSTQADEIVRNASGDRILLKDDGTWVVISIQEAITGPDFRMTNWGMPFFEVKSLEKTNLIYEKRNHVLGYATSILDYKCRLYYQFANRILTSASYQIHDSFPDKNQYVEIYFKIQDLIRKKYGEPVKEELIWDADTSIKTDNPSLWYKAVERGDLALRTSWKTEKTNITLACNYEAAFSQKIALGLYYSSVLLLQMIVIETEEEEGPLIFEEF